MLKHNALKDLQQQNFKDILERMSAIHGWEILESNDLLALKAPSPIPLVNMVWGVGSDINLQTVKQFYSGSDFFWHTADDQKTNLPNTTSDIFAKHAEHSYFPEMLLNLNDYVKPVISSKIRIALVNSSEELQLWTETAIATFGFAEDGFKEFFYPLIQVAGCTPFLIYYDNEPAATAMVYCGEQVAGIYAMSTKVEFRRKGLGSAAVHACVALALDQQLNYAVLYASELGYLLYKQLGFKVTQMLHEYNFKSLEGPADDK